jgi:anti-sigma28 factor (negative regulator of flagellin synthesis)
VLFTVFLVRIPCDRKFDDERTKIRVKAVDALSNHPLLPQKPKTMTITEKQPNNPLSKGSSGKSNITSSKVTVVEDALDPLSMFASDPLSAKPPAAPIDTPLASSDPLMNPSAPSKSAIGKAATETTTSSKASSSSTATEQQNLGKSLWETRKQQLRRDFSVVGKLKISNLTWNESEGTGVEDGTSVRKVDKYDKRMQLLEKRQATKDNGQRVEVSQSEYESAVTKLSTNLDKSWANDERVESLKIAIQLGKLLSNTNVAQFYPCMFVIVTDVLNHFGDLVYNRLLTRAEDTYSPSFTTGTTGGVSGGSIGGSSKKNGTSNKGGKLPDNWTSEDIPSIAKDTCRNWLYKTGCIRDLLPRIYVEISLLRCYRFLTDTDYPIILNRISNMIRGLGDPLLANYARLYLFLIANDYLPVATAQPSSVNLVLLQDLLFTFRSLKESWGLNENDSNSLKIELNAYLTLFSPVFEWIINRIGRNASKEIFQSVLSLYRDHCNDSLVLYYIIDGFDSSLWIHGLIGMITLIKSCDISAISIVELFTILGKRLLTNPPSEDLRIPVLNEVWKIVSKSNDLLQYVKCASVWLALVQKYYSEREMIVILGQVSNRITSASSGEGGGESGSNDQFIEPVAKQVELMITDLIGQSSTFGSAVLSSEHLLKMLDIFKGIQKVQLCKVSHLSFLCNDSFFIVDFFPEFYLFLFGFSLFSCLLSCVWLPAFICTLCPSLALAALIFSFPLLRFCLFLCFMLSSF